MESEKLRLGKLEHQEDERTLRMGAFFGDIEYPNTFDFDKGRAKFPVSSWGNDEWGNCVIAAQAEYSLRAERVEHRRTVPINSWDVVMEYRRQTDAINPGDARDNGLVVLQAMRQWRNHGWLFRISATGEPRVHRIAAYGELNARDRSQLRAAIYLLHGAPLGLWLPLSAQGQVSTGVWDVVEGNAPSVQPGSWGGHMVFAKRYDQDNIYVKTWGRELRVTNRFIEAYCDEAWACVDDLDSKSKFLDVAAMTNELRNIGATQVESDHHH